VVLGRRPGRGPTTLQGGWTEKKKYGLLATGSHSGRGVDWIFSQVSGKILGRAESCVKVLPGKEELPILQKQDVKRGRDVTLEDKSEPLLRSRRDLALYEVKEGGEGVLARIGDPQREFILEEEAGLYDPMMPISAMA